jgi:hypothetical protein
MNWIRRVCFGLSVVAVLASSVAYAEDIKTYGGCEICPGQIHYGPDESKEILGPEGLELVSKLRRNKAIKIDLDGVLKNGSQEDSDKGYALVISSGQNVIDIKDVHDMSYLLLVTDHLRARQTGMLDRWHPEIYLQSRLADRINRDDSLEVAWTKFKKSNIYQWVGLKEDEIKWRGLLREKILKAVRLMGDQQT